MDFSVADLQQYVEVEILHSLDSVKLERKIAEYATTMNQEQYSRKRFSAHDFFTLLQKFYHFLGELRYAVTPFTLTGENGTYVKGQYVQGVNEKYGYFIQEIDELLLRLFGDLAEDAGFSDELEGLDRKIVNDLESITIFHFYDHIRKALESTLELYDDQVMGSLSAVLGGLGTSHSRIIARFVIEKASKSEKYDNNCGYRLVRNKYMRYAGYDRTAYWGSYARCHLNEPLFNCIGGQLDSFLTATVEAPFDTYMVSFVVLLLTKYHIILHRYAPDTFRFLGQHIDKVRSRTRELDDVIVRAQKAFTFTRLVGKYFSEIFDKDDLDASRPIGKAIEILGYLRRGFAFSSLNVPEKAYNDYTGAEKQTSILRDNYSERKERFVRLYMSLMVPYVYSLKGELYRKDFSFHNAQQYLCNAVSRLSEMEESDASGIFPAILGAGRKIAHTYVAIGKGYFELGEFRKALKWYLRGLERWLNILENGKGVSVSRICEHLESIRLDPKLNKMALYNELKELTDSVIDFVSRGDGRSVEMHGAILSDVLNRIGFLILMFNLPEYEVAKHEEEEFQSEDVSLERLAEIKEGLCRNLLAGKWIAAALRLNPWNSLARLNEIFFDQEEVCQTVLAELDKVKDELGVWDLMKTGPDLMFWGEPRNVVYHLVARRVLEALKLGKGYGDGTREQGVARNLMRRMVMHADEFATRNAELHKYLTKASQLQAELKDIRLYVLRRWSSINPAVPRPSAFKMKGGGYFITFMGKGIAIDPGIDFLENLYAEGFSVGDIHYILSTHDHIDHIAEIDTILSLHFRRCKIEKERPLTLVLNPSVSARYGFLVNQDPNLFRRMELTRYGARVDIFDQFSVQPIPVFHRDICSPVYSNSLGFVLIFYPDTDREFRIGITGDTRYREQRREDGGYEYQGDPLTDPFLDTDILVAHINGTPFRELKAYCELGLDDDRLEGELRDMEKTDILRPIINQVKYSLGYEVDAQIGEMFRKIDAGQLERELMGLDGEHMFLHGISRTYESFARASDRRPRLFIISETNEEMGFYRHKVAQLLNRYYEDLSGSKCMTGDIGMAIRANPYAEDPDRRIEVRCSRCSTNNDYTDDDKFHRINNINEVCLKWEEEGLVYYCPRHDPESLNRKIGEFGFAERLEKYQPLRHIDIRLR